MKNIVILGGYGLAGLETAKLLIEHTDCNIILAGRNINKAIKAAQELNQAFNSNKVQGLMLNANNINDMAKKIKDYDLIIVSIPLATVGDNVVKAAIKAEIDYIDLNLNDQKQKTLKESAGIIKKKGLTFISEAGFVPGTPAFMLRLLNEKFDKMNEVTFSGYFNEKEVSIGTCEDMIKEVSTKPLVLKDGKWIESSVMKSVDFDFGDKIGLKKCYPLRMVEIEDLAVQMNLEKCGVYSAGIGGKAGLILVVWSMLKLYKKESSAKKGTKLLYKTVNKTRKPPYMTMVNAKGTGLVEGRKKDIALSLSHSDGWIGTAIPVTAFIFQMLNGTINKPGLYRMGELVNIDQFKNDLINLGMELVIKAS